MVCQRLPERIERLAIQFRLECESCKREKFQHVLVSN